MTFFITNFLNRGLPFILLIVGASYGMTVMTDIRYKTSQHLKHLGLTKEDMELKGWKSKKLDLVEEYKEMTENLDINNWENIRGPRPWEDDNTKYIEVIERRKQEREEKVKKKGSFWAG